MAAAVTRELSIVYGAFTVGGPTDYLIHNKIRVERNYLGVVVTFNVILTNHATESSFATAVQAIEAAFRLPRQRLRIILGAETVNDFNPIAGASGNTGYNASPNISKVAGDADTGRSREYEVTVALEEPADLAGQEGRRTSTVEIRLTPSRRKDVFISGEYTALANRDAAAQYANAIDTFVGSVINALGGTIGTDFELVEERYSFDDTDKNLQFSRIYEEIISNQTQELLDDPEIVRLQLSSSLIRTAPGDTNIVGAGAPSRLIRVIVSFDCSVDKTLTTDLVAVFDNKILQHAIAQGKNAGDIATAAVVDLQPQYDYKENRIAGTLAIVGVAGSGVIEAQLIVELNDTSGLILIPVWDGQRYSRHEFEGPAARVRTFTSIKRTVVGGSQGLSPVQAKIAQAVAANDGGAGGLGRHGGGALENRAAGINVDVETGIGDAIESGKGPFRPLLRVVTAVPKTMGIPETGETFAVVEETRVEVDTFVQAPKGGGVIGSNKVAVQPGFGAV